MKKRYKLSKSIKKAWIQALESGKYSKNVRFLKGNNKHCPLGVLAEELGILKQHDRGYWGVPACEAPEDFLFEAVYFLDAYFLPDFIIPMDVQIDLTKISDESHTFDSSIDYIKKYL